MARTKVASEPAYRRIVAEPGVYKPQEDSWLLCEELGKSQLAHDSRVLDICTGSGIIAIEAARLGAREVLALDIADRAIDCTRRNAARAGVRVNARVGSFDDAAALEPFDVLLANPPYVPSGAPPEGKGIQRAWDAGSDGRSVLDPLCESAAALLAPGGTIMLVQSEFAAPERTLLTLKRCGFEVGVVASRTIPFGPVLTDYAERLEATGRLEPGRRTEELVVIRADRQ